MSMPAGWYPNPDGSPGMRWWNGTEWTAQVTGPQAYPGVGAPQQQRRRKWPLILAVVVGSVVLIGGCTAVFVVPKVVDAVAGPIRGADNYLRARRDSRLDQAYALLCSTLRSQLTIEQYQARISSEEANAGHLVSFGTRGIHSQPGGAYATVDVEVETERSSSRIQARMAKEDGKWLWCGSRPLGSGTSFG
ncbi:MAG TPA: DUF2510 domain-containing protein [Acidimicrobiales bacterium]|nr:DUF2510 domain-containing protein [Acidimicrobiales bacterium]